MKRREFITLICSGGGSGVAAGSARAAPRDASGWVSAFRIAGA